MTEQENFDFIDAISLLSFVIGYQNLMENRQQSAHNDISAANDAQAEYMLGRIESRLDKQDELLNQILEELRK